MCVCMLIYLKQETIVHVLFFLSRRWESKPDITSSRCQSQCLTRCREAFRHIAGEGITWTKNKSLYLWGLLQSVGVGDMMTWLNRKGALVLIPQVLNQLQQCRWDMLRYVHSSTVSPTCCFCYQLHTSMHNGRGARLHPLWSRTHSTCDSRGINYPCTAKGNELRCDWENPKWVLKQSESSHSVPSAPCPPKTTKEMYLQHDLIAWAHYCRMSHVNIIQGLFTLAVLGDGGIGSSTCTEARKLMNLPRIQAHLSVLPVHSTWLFMANCNKYPYQSVLFLLSSSPLWASQKGNVWHTHCSSSQHHNGSSFWLEDGLTLDPSNTHQGFQETQRLQTFKDEKAGAGVWRSWHTCRFVGQLLWTELGHSQDAGQMSHLWLTAARDGLLLFPLPSAPAGLESS